MTRLSRLLWRYAWRAAKSGRPDRAVRWALWYGEAARLRGEDWEVAAIAGEILMQLPGEQELAEELLREAAQWDMRDRHAHLLLGVLLEERNPRESAEYLRAAREAPSPCFRFDNLLEQTRATLWRDGEWSGS